jgi:hypothetical protein
MPKIHKLANLKHSLDSAFNLKINIENDILMISSLEILELGKIILTEFQNRAKMPSVAITTANVALKGSKKRGRPKGSKNKLK